MTVLVKDVMPAAGTEVLAGLMLTRAATAVITAMLAAADFLGFATMVATDTDHRRGTLDAGM